MKKLSLIAILALLVFVGLPYVTGRVAETVTLQLAEQVNATHSEVGRFEVRDYQRSLRSTKSSFSWSPPSDVAAAGFKPIVYNCHGKHGLLSYSYACQAQDVPQYTDFVASQLNGVDPITIGGKISVFGTATQTIRLDAFTMTDELGESMSVAAGKLELVTDENLQFFTVMGNFGGLQMLAEDGQLHLKPVKLEGQMELNEHNLLIGDLTLRAEGLELTSLEDTKVRLNDIKFSSVTKEQGDTMVMAYRLTADQVSQSDLSSVNTNQQESLDGLVFDVEFSGIHMATFAAITKRLQELAKSDAQGELGSQQESTRNAQMLAILPELQDLLSKGLELNVDLGADYKNEPIKGKLNIELLDKLSLSDLILLSVQPLAFFSKLDVSVRNSLPAELIESNQQTANAVASSQWYKRKGDHYEIDFQLNGNGISLNGDTISLEELLAILAQ